MFLHADANRVSDMKTRCSHYNTFPATDAIPVNSDVLVPELSYLSILDLVSAILLSEDTLKP